MLILFPFPYPCFLTLFPLYSSSLHLSLSFPLCSISSSTHPSVSPPLQSLDEDCTLEEEDEEVVEEEDEIDQFNDDTFGAGAIGESQKCI